MAAVVVVAIKLFEFSVLHAEKRVDLINIDDALWLNSFAIRILHLHYENGKPFCQPYQLYSNPNTETITRNISLNLA